MKITYIHQSSFLVELKNSILLFDYYTGTIPSLDNSKNIYVFASHAHYDHFNEKIFELSTRYNNVHYILSDDINKYKLNNITYIKPYENITIDDINVSTLESTDEGVAFIINIENKNIYHAGDLHWWHWSGESSEYNENMEFKFRTQIDRIKNNHFDIAFLPLDPRLGEYYYLGFDYFIQNTNTSYAIPMHLWSEYDLVAKFINSDISKDYKNTIINLSDSKRVFNL